MTEQHHNSDECGFSTNAIHAGQEPEQWKSRAIIPPISLSTTFKQFSAGNHGGFEYGRSGNPTRAVLEKCIAPLENGKYALTFSSGLAATTTLSYLLKSGDHILSVDDVYGGTNRFLRQCASKMGLESSFVNMRDLKEVEKGIKSNTAMVWFETPTNPTLKLIDIKAVSDLVKSKAPKAIIVVDNTFATPFFQKPLDLGADIVLHSISKYMNGHTDVVMGAVIINDDSLYGRVAFLQNSLGAVPSPFDCYLVNRGLKTLSIRMERHQENGLKLAKSMEANPRVQKVIYPGLKSHPDHETYKKQMSGFGGMISVYIKGGRKETDVFLANLKVFSLAESLGGYESVIEHPAVMTHASVPEADRAILGIDDNFVRMSVGIEDYDDLLNDVNNALIKAIPNI